ncbi:MAG: DNA repair protein RecN [Clostridia bacterium]|nr:DNA repair protein RecN [Clostridia bacterium]
MLVELTIKNIALIESLRVEFAQGFNVLTGETGAGKSIVVDSISLALGGRADRDMIRTGAEKGMVQALFDISGNERAMEYVCAHDIDAEDGLIAIRRELNREGRNICRVSDVVVPLSTLRELTAMLMDIHGQHEHQALMNPARHLEFLDGFGGEAHAKARAEVAGLYAARSKIATELKKRMNDASEKERLSDMLSFQVQEISAAKLKAGEEQKLERKLAMLENSERIRGGIETAYTLVYQGDGRSPSAQEALLRSADAMDHIASLNERYAQLAARLRELFYGVQDAGYELQSLLDDLDSEPELLEKVAARLDMIGRLERKYGSTVEEVIAFGAAAADRLNELKGSDEAIAGLKKSYKEADASLKAACARLSALRRESAVKLAAEICEQLKDLGMAKTRFEVRVDPEPKPTSQGMDRVEFMISPNPGEPLRPLASIASGGEISRVMLALKAIAVDSEGVDAMIFDEIDTGVSGRMAQVVGEKMCLIAKNRQVLSITHLPQIAALGDAHFLVEKVAGENRTDTHVRALDWQGRVQEISRLVGGADDSESSLSHAEHMLKAAEERKAAL